MDRELIIRLAVQAGITPWAKKEWSKDRFVQTDEGMDGDAACLIQFAALVAAQEREVCAKVCDDWPNGRDDVDSIAAAIRSRT